MHKGHMLANVDYHPTSAARKGTDNYEVTKYIDVVLVCRSVNKQISSKVTIT